MSLRQVPRLVWVLAAVAPTLLWPLCGPAGLVAAAMVLWSRRLAGVVPP